MGGIEAGPSEPAEGDEMMMQLKVVTLLVNDQDQALRFFVDQAGFSLLEDNRLGDYRWLLVAAPGTPEVGINLALAGTAEQRALVGKQGGGQPLFGFTTDDCQRDFLAMKARGVRFEGEPQTMPYGTGVTFHDLYGNKLYLNQEPG
jgi:catechol 2,3-dioxygenase-like lactoylglutathione lyase family enzyme